MRWNRGMDDDLARDIQQHIELETAENVERGMSLEEARRAAMLKFGNVARTMEDTRAVWHWMWWDRLMQDTHYALRGLRRSPLFTAMAVITLALGIGMNTAVFSVVSAALIKPLPYPDGHRIVWLANYNKRFHFEASSGPDFADWRDQAQSFEAMAAYRSVDSTIQDGEQSAKHPLVEVSPALWQITGVRPARGQLFSESDPASIVLSWRLFEQRFGGDARVIGKSVRVDGRTRTILGVLPRDFHFLPPTDPMPGAIAVEAEAFVPDIVTPETRSRAAGMLIALVIGKLKPDVTVEQARAEMLTIQGRIAQANPAMRRFYESAEMRVTPLQEKLVGGSRRALLILLAAVGVVLLIACVNLGNLLLARATARNREIAIRSAIGAGRARLLRQFLVEGMVLSILGGAAGLALARGADVLLVRLNPTAIPRLSEVSMDWRVLGFAVAVSLVSGVAFGLAPLVSVSRGPLHLLLKDGGHGSTAGARGLRLRKLLVTGEIALALLLLTAAGLMLKSFSRMYAFPTGFEPEKIGVVKVFLSGPGYRGQEAIMQYTRQVLDRVAQVPGADAVALMAFNGSGAINVDGPPRYAPGQAPRIFYRAASSGYRTVTGIPLIEGRWLSDDEPAPVIAVNQTLARRIFGSDAAAIGQRLRMPAETATIVGVVGDLKMLTLDAAPEPEVIVPYRPSTLFRRADVLVKTRQDPRAILGDVRKVVQQIDPTQPPYGLTTLEDALGESIAPRRFNMALLGAFALTALSLALVGIYGVIAYGVSQRTHEIGVRLALGARRREIVAMVVKQGIAIALVGVVVGSAAALALTRLMSAMLYDVRPNDPWVFTASAAGLALTAVAASWIPALKAAGVDPLQALRCD